MHSRMPPITILIFLIFLIHILEVREVACLVVLVDWFLFLHLLCHSALEVEGMGFWLFSRFLSSSLLGHA